MHQSSFADTPRTKTAQSKTSSPPRKKIYLIRRSLFSSDPADKEKRFAARIPASAQRVVRAIEKRFCLGVGVLPPARSAEAPPHFSVQGTSEGLGMRARTWPSPLSLGLALRTFASMKSCPRHPPKCYKVVSFVLEFGSAGERKRVSWIAAWKESTEEKPTQCRNPPHCGMDADQETEAQASKICRRSVWKPVPLGTNPGGTPVYPLSKHFSKDTAGCHRLCETTILSLGSTPQLLFLLRFYGERVRS